MKIYLVGGAVRDLLLNRAYHEKDYVVVGATIEQMVRLGYKPVGKDFPVFLHPETHDEYALARTERKIAKGYHGFVFYTAPNVTLEQDLARRDLTINAIAMDDNGHIIDPYNGQSDLNNKILRHVSHAFIEDPVRILRLARFYARFYSEGFTIAEETLLLIRQMVLNGEVDALVPERVWQEFHKALQEPHPEQFLVALRQGGVLAKLFSEIDALFGVPQNPKSHPEIDCGIHTLSVIQQASQLTSTPEVRFAALCHDFGKALVPMVNWPQMTRHEQLGIKTIENFCQRFKVPKHFADLALLLGQWHGQLHSVLKLTPEAILTVLHKTDAFRRPKRFQQLLLAAEADSRGRLGFENSSYPQRVLWQKLLEQTQKIDVAKLLAQGLKGQKLAQAIKAQRLEYIQKFLQNA